jgi:hypothetical protein
MVTESAENMKTSESPGSSGPKRVAWPVIALLSLTILLSSVTSVDRIAETEHASLFQRALVTFALARTLNGVISAVQGTELALQPAGVGVTLTPGQVLDPINDMIERFSWIMLGATLSLGVQQVLLDVGQWWGVRVLLAALGLGWLWLRARKQAGQGRDSANTARLVLRVFIIVLFVRFAVPCAMIANEALYHLFLEDRYAQSTQVIETAGAEIQQAGSQASPEDSEEDESGLFESLGRSFASTRESMNFSQRVDAIGKRATEVIEHLIQLSVVFILQTGILPVAFLWIFLQLFKQVFRH